MRWLLLAILLLFPIASMAEPIRLAVYNVSMARKGPGLLYRDIVGDKNKQVGAVAEIIARAKPDVLLLMSFDNDAELRALTSFQMVLREKGVDLPYAFAPMQNSGVPSGDDLNGDGRLGGPADAFGYGLFRGQGQMAILSKYPIASDKAQDYSMRLWRQVKGAELPTYPDGRPFPSFAAQEAMRLSSKAHWVVPVLTPDGAFNILASHHSPPVFDGPEDQNGKRNAGELQFWLNHLDRDKISPIVLMAGLNADPHDGDGPHELVRQLLLHPRVQDPEPESLGGLKAADASQKGNPRHDTANWQSQKGPGNLRVDYILPDSRFGVTGAGVFWPETSAPEFPLIEAAETKHRLVWVDVELP